MNSIEIDLTIGLIGTSLFIFKNPYKNYKYIISVFVVGLFTSQALFLSLDNILPGQIIWIVSTFGLLTFYSLRFRDKQTKKFMDFVKVAGLLLLIIYPLPFYSLVSVGDSLIWTVTNGLTFYFLGTIYIYDRLILKPETMKKKFIIILTIQTVLMGLFIIYAFVQKLEADVQKEKSIEAQMEAVNSFKKAEELRKLSEERVNNMTLEIDKLREEIKKCR